MTTDCSQSMKLLIIEPFYGGSHKKLIDIVCKNLPENAYMLIAMKAKKWHWRARTSALYVSLQIPKVHNFEVLFCTSVLPLAELLGLRPDLVKLRKIVYFHENQLEFPVRIIKERDFQYGFNEILTCITADKILFNSFYNQQSFLMNVSNHLKLQPDYRIKNLDCCINPKCQVIYYPLDLDTIDEYLSLSESVFENTDDNILHIVWPHRWEFDKNPDEFYKVLCRLDESRYSFKVSILGESFKEKPDIFAQLSNRLNSRLIHCGFVDSPAQYYNILKKADVVISTAIHEFFGVAVLEAVYCGCIPVLPNRLAYKELYGNIVEEMYDNENELYDILADLCQRKQNGNLEKTYRHVALPFDAKKWFNILMDVLEFKTN